MVSRTKCIREKCFSCGYDDSAPGTFLEQIAVCPVTDCGLHPVRPLPKHCRRHSEIVSEAITAIEAKLEKIDRRWFEEGR